LEDHAERFYKAFENKAGLILQPLQWTNADEGYAGGLIIETIDPPGRFPCSNYIGNRTGYFYYCIGLQTHSQIHIVSQASTRKNTAHGTQPVAKNINLLRSPPVKLYGLVGTMLHPHGWLSAMAYNSWTKYPLKDSRLLLLPVILTRFILVLSSIRFEKLMRESRTSKKFRCSDKYP